MSCRRWFWVLPLILLLAGCSAVRDVLGIQSPGDPSVTLQSAEPRWLLIKNPRFGDVPSEPEYIWVEEDKVPITVTTLLRGKGAIIAPPEIVAKYGAPPGGGRISPRQGVPLAVGPPPAGGERGPVAKGNSGATPVAGVAASAVPAPAAAAPPAPELPHRGYVVYVDTTRIVIDLTAADGLKPGSVVSIRRDKVPIVHPITGEVLGTLDEEVATARITETREKFSVAEVQSVAPGSQIQVKDRAVLR